MPKLENLGTSLILCLYAKTGLTKFWEPVFGICLHLFPVCFENILVILSIFFGSSAFSRAFATLPSSKHVFLIIFCSIGVPSTLPDLFVYSFVYVCICTSVYINGVLTLI